jgi:hypothetical protein
VDGSGGKGGVTYGWRGRNMRNGGMSTEELITLQGKSRGCNRPFSTLPAPEADGVGARAEVPGGEVVQDDAGSAEHFLEVVDGMVASGNHGDVLAAEKNRFAVVLPKPAVSARISPPAPYR